MKFSSSIRSTATILRRLGNVTGPNLTNWWSNAVAESAKVIVCPLKGGRRDFLFAHSAGSATHLVSLTWLKTLLKRPLKSPHQKKKKKSDGCSVFNDHGHLIFKVTH